MENSLEPADEELLSPLSWHSGSVVSTDWVPETPDQTIPLDSASNTTVTDATSRAQQGVEPEAVLDFQWEEAELRGERWDKPLFDSFPIYETPNGVTASTSSIAHADVMSSFCQAKSTGNDLPSVSDWELFGEQNQPHASQNISPLVRSGDYYAAIIDSDLWQEETVRESGIFAAGLPLSITEEWLPFNEASITLSTDYENIKSPYTAVVPTVPFQGHGSLVENPYQSDPEMILSPSNDDESISPARARYQAAIPLFDHLTKRRQPFQDLGKRWETGSTRKIGACVRCRMQRVRVSLFFPHFKGY